MRYFGTRYDVPTYEDAEEIPIPVGDGCIWCEEPIEDGDDGIQYINGPVAHRECWLRQGLGGANHINGTCTCRGGSNPPDPPGLTRREAAKAAIQAFEDRYGAGYRTLG